MGALALALGALAAPAGAGDGRITSLAVNPQDGTLWVGTGRGVFRSGDQGRTLAPAPLPGKARDAEVTAVVVEPRSGLALYVATAGQGVFKSEDGGTRWTAANQGLDGLDVRGLAVAPNDGRLHAQVDGKGLFRSFDGGRAWERVDNGPPGRLHAFVSVNLPTGMGGIFLLRRDRSGAGWPGLILRLHAGGRSSHDAAGDGLRGGSLDDAGDVRHAARQPLGEPGRGQDVAPVGEHVRHTALAVHPRIPETVFAGTADGRILRSAGGGGSWEAAR